MTVVNRKAMLERGATVTTILTPADEPDNTRNDTMLTDRSRRGGAGSSAGRRQRQRGSEKAAGSSDWGPVLSVNRRQPAPAPRHEPLPVCSN